MAKNCSRARRQVQGGLVEHRSGGTYISQLQLLERELAEGQALTPHQRKSLTPPARRLLEAWNDRHLAPSDIAVLIRQVVRHARANNDAATLRLPLDVPLTDACKQASLDLAPYGMDRVSISPGQLWNPDWLRGNPLWVELAIAAPGEYRLDGLAIPTESRTFETYPVDPAVKQLFGVNVYRSVGQAEAVRTATWAVPGTVTHIVLPTGGGKSLAGLAPGLLDGSGLTVVVVPTIALAIDQERATRERFDVELPSELAFHSGRTAEERQTIIQRVREGTQRVLFTSPEALIHTLAAAVRDAARQGHLRCLVIDEAHLVRTWGLDFRPDFQLLGALRHELDTEARAAGHPGFNTVLLTATLSEAAFRTNDRLFRGDTTHWVSSATLRTEHRFLIDEASAGPERDERFLDALRHLPRPAIVYTTTKAEAYRLTRLLHEAGFRRVAAFTGDTESRKRERILAGWQGRAEASRYDVVVGTAAFGLGVDQEDVRTVVHVGVPSSVDRYYQEVGRAGRDGHAAVALLLSSAHDLRVSSGIESATLIGDDKIWNRWVAMRSDTSSKNGVEYADTSVVPSHVGRASEANSLWNRNSLTLMAQAGLVELLPVPPPRRGEDEPEEVWLARSEKAWADFHHQVGFRLMAEGSLTQDHVEQALAEARDDVRRTEEASRSRAFELIQGHRCWGEIFAEEYSFSVQQPEHSRAQQVVQPACSGCPGCRRAKLMAVRPVTPTPSVGLVRADVSPALREQLGHGNHLIVAASRPELKESASELFKRLARHGIRRIVLTDDLLDPAYVADTHLASRERLIAVDRDLLGAHPFSVPTLILASGERRFVLHRSIHAPGAPRILLLMNAATPDTEYPHLRLADVHPPALQLQQLLKVV